MQALNEAGELNNTFSSQVSSGSSRFSDAKRGNVKPNLHFEKRIPHRREQTLEKRVGSMIVPCRLPSSPTVTRTEPGVLRGTPPDS